MLKITPTFWQDVEKNLKYVLYGDSVAEDCIINYKLKNKKYSDTLSKLWKILYKTGECVFLETHRGNQYLHFDKHFSFYIESYNPTTKKIIYAKPYYIMRHYYKGEIIKLMTECVNIKLTKNHSLIDIIDDKIVKLNPCETTYLYHYTKKVPIISKKNINYDNFVYDFEVDEYHNFAANGILCHNTDSLYIKIPKKFEDINESIEECEFVAKKINELISHYYNSFLLPKMGVDPKYNETFFKTELTANSMLLLSTKKTYAYNQTSKERKIYDPAVTKYVGIPVIKSDTVPFTKDFLINLIENIALKQDINTSKELDKLAKESYYLIINKIENYDFEYISAPGKWSDKDYDSEPPSVIGMRLYNTLTDTDTFRPGSFGIYFPIEIKNLQLFNSLDKFKSKHRLGDISISKINYITLPYNYNKELIIRLFNEYKLLANITSFWNWSKMIDNEVIKRILEVIKNHG
jgi:hypothetical protein